ncbi:hypothetical protein SSPIM334S_07343 [Streptomyces spiroverticillatus]
MASSATVTSIGVLNVEIDDTNDSTRPSCSIISGSAKYASGGAGSRLAPSCAGGSGYAATSSYSSRSGADLSRAICRSIWCSRCPRHCGRFRMRGARPSGCRASRIAFGAASRCGATPPSRPWMPLLEAMTLYMPSTTSAGYGSYPRSNWSIPARSAPIDGSSSGVSANCGA